MENEELPYINIKWIEETHYHIDTNLPQDLVANWLNVLSKNLKHNIENGLLINPKIIN
jgi:hypothetical protein